MWRGQLDIEAIGLGGVQTDDFSSTLSGLWQSVTAGYVIGGPCGTNPNGGVHLWFSNGCVIPELPQQFLLMHHVVVQFVLISGKKHNLEIVMDQIYKMKEFIYNIKFLEVYGLILIISTY